MKRRELHCTYHSGVVCMANGTLHLVQMVLPGTEGYDGEQVVPVGSFCTVSSLAAWCADQGTVGAQKNAFSATRRPKPAHPENRPLQATRQPRRSLAPRRTE